MSADAWVTPIKDLGIAPGDSWFDRGDGEVFSDVEVVHSDDGTFRMEGRLTCVNFLQGFAEMHDASRRCRLYLMPGMRCCADSGHDGSCRNFEDFASDWLNERLDKIEAFFGTRYAGLEWDGGCDQWSDQHFIFSVPVSPDQTPEDAFDALWNATGAVPLYNELDAGTYGCEYVWRVLRDHLQRTES